MVVAGTPAFDAFARSSPRVRGPMQIHEITRANHKTAPAANECDPSANVRP